MGENFVEHLHSNLCFGTNWDHHNFHLHSVDMPVLILLRSNTGPERTRSKESAEALEGVDVEVRIKKQLASPIHRGYYTVAWRYEFYCEWVKYCFCHEKIKFISSSLCVMFFLLYRQKDIIREEMTEITSSINSGVRLWKINHSGPGCSFYEV